MEKGRWGRGGGGAGRFAKKGSDLTHSVFILAIVFELPKKMDEGDSLNK